MPVPEIEVFRKKYPVYNDLDDNTIATKLATKYPDAYGDLVEKVKTDQLLGQRPPLAKFNTPSGIQKPEQSQTIPNQVYKPSIQQQELNTPEQPLTIYTPPDYQKKGTYTAKLPEVAVTAPKETNPLSVREAKDILEYSKLPQPTSIGQSPEELQRAQYLKDIVGALETYAPLYSGAKSGVEGTQQGIRDIQSGNPLGILAGLIKGGFGVANLTNPQLAMFNEALKQIEPVIGQDATEYIFSPVSKITQPETDTGKYAAEIGDVLTNLLAFAGAKKLGTEGLPKVGEKIAPKLYKPVVEQMPEGYKANRFTPEGINYFKERLKDPATTPAEKATIAKLLKDENINVPVEAKPEGIKGLIGEEPLKAGQNQTIQEVAKPQFAIKDRNQEQVNLLKEAGIPEEKAPDYVLDSYADGEKLGKYAEQVIEGKITREEAALKIKEDYNKMITGEKDAPNLQTNEVSNEALQTPTQVIPETPVEKPELVKKSGREILTEMKAERDRWKKEISDYAKDKDIVDIMEDGGFRAIMAKSTKEKGKWQVTTFTKNGEPFGDTTYDTKDEAIKELASKKATINKQNDEYVYGHPTRPISTFTIPFDKRFKRLEDINFQDLGQTKKFGRVVLKEPLTEQEMADYELYPIKDNKLNRPSSLNEDIVQKDVTVPKTAEPVSMEQTKSPVSSTQANEVVTPEVKSDSPKATALKKDISDIEKDIADTDKRLEKLRSSYDAPFEGGTRRKTTTFNARTGQLAERKDELRKMLKQKQDELQAEITNPEIDSNKESAYRMLGEGKKDTDIIKALGLPNNRANMDIVRGYRREFQKENAGKFKEKLGEVTKDTVRGTINKFVDKQGWAEIPTDDIDMASPPADALVQELAFKLGWKKLNKNNAYEYLTQKMVEDGDFPIAKGKMVGKEYVVDRLNEMIQEKRGLKTSPKVVEETTIKAKPKRTAETYQEAVLQYIQDGGKVTGDPKDLRELGLERKNISPNGTPLDKLISNLGFSDLSYQNDLTESELVRDLLYKYDTPEKRKEALNMFKGKTPAIDNKVKREADELQAEYDRLDDIILNEYLDPDGNILKDEVLKNYDTITKQAKASEPVLLKYLRDKDQELNAPEPENYEDVFADFKEEITNDRAKEIIETSPVEELQKLTKDIESKAEIAADLSDKEIEQSIQSADEVLKLTSPTVKKSKPKKPEQLGFEGMNKPSFKTGEEYLKPTGKPEETTPLFNQKVEDKGQGKLFEPTEPDVALGASARTRPYSYKSFKQPIIGKSGAKLTGYEWQYEWEDLGNDKARRISDWTKAEINNDTGREIVHQFHVEMPDGKSKIVSSESVLSLLGYTDKNTPKSLPSLISAVKTLAKQKMQLEIMEAKEKNYDDLWAKYEKAEKPKIVETEEPFVKEEWQKGAFKVFQMGDVWERQANKAYYDTETKTTKYKPINDISENTKSQLTINWIRARVKEEGGEIPFGINGLKGRVERQQKKVDLLIEESKKQQDIPLSVQPDKKAVSPENQPSDITAEKIFSSTREQLVPVINGDMAQRRKMWNTLWEYAQDKLDNPEAIREVQRNMDKVDEAYTKRVNVPEPKETASPNTKFVQDPLIGKRSEIRREMRKLFDYANKQGRKGRSKESILKEIQPDVDRLNNEFESIQKEISPKSKVENKPETSDIPPVKSQKGEGQLPSKEQSPQPEGKEVFRAEFEKVKNIENKVSNVGKGFRGNLYTEYDYVSPRHKVLVDYVTFELKEKGYENINVNMGKRTTSPSAYVEASLPGMQTLTFRISEHAPHHNFNDVLFDESDPKVFEKIERYFNPELFTKSIAGYEKPENTSVLEKNNPQVKSIPDEFIDEEGKFGKKIKDYKYIRTAIRETKEGIKHEFTFQKPIYEYKKAVSSKEPTAKSESKPQSVKSESQKNENDFTIQETKKEPVKSQVQPEGKNLKAIYHGTDKIFDNFDIKKSADGTIWFTDNEDFIKRGEIGASAQGQIIKRFIDENELKLGGWEENDKYSTDELIAMGYDGLKLPSEGETTYQIYYPEKLKKEPVKKSESPRTPNNGVPKGSNALKVLYQSGKKANILLDKKFSMADVTLKSDPIKSLTYGKVNTKSKNVWDTFSEIPSQTKSEINRELGKQNENLTPEKSNASDITFGIGLGQAFEPALNKLAQSPLFISNSHVRAKWAANFKGVWNQSLNPPAYFAEKSPQFRKIYDTVERYLVRQHNRDLNNAIENPEILNKFKDIRNLKEQDKTGLLKALKNYHEVYMAKPTTYYEAQYGLPRGLSLEQFIEKYSLNPEQVNALEHIDKAYKEGLNLIKQGEKERLIDLTPTISEHLTADEFKEIYPDYEKTFDIKELDSKAIDEIWKNEQWAREEIADYLVENKYKDYNKFLYINLSRPFDGKSWVVAAEKFRTDNNKTPEKLFTYFDTQAKAEAEIAKLKKTHRITLYGKADDLLMQNDFWGMVSDSDLMRLVESSGSVTMSDPTIQKLMESIKARGWRKHTIQRNYTPGLKWDLKEFETNVVNYLREASNSKNKITGIARADKAFDEWYNSVSEIIKSPYRKEGTTRDIEGKRIAGKRELVKDLEYAQKFLGGVKSSDASTMDVFRSLTSAWFLGGVKIPYLVQQAVQPVQTVLPLAVKELGGFKGEKVFWTSIDDAAKYALYIADKHRGKTNKHGLSDEFISVMDEIRLMRKVSSFGTQELTGQSLDPSEYYGTQGSKISTIAMKYWSGLGGGVELGSRIISASTFYNIAKEKGANQRGLQEGGIDKYVADMIDKSMGEFGKVGRIPLLNPMTAETLKSGKLKRMIRKMYLVFKNYASYNTSLWGSLIRSRSYAALATKGAVSLGLHGTLAFPFVASMIWLADTFLMLAGADDDKAVENKVNEWEEYLNDKTGWLKAGSFLRRGIGTYLGIDISSLFNETAPIPSENIQYSQVYGNKWQDWMARLAEQVAGAPGALTRDAIEKGVFGVIVPKLQEKFAEKKLSIKEQERITKNIQTILPSFLKNIAKAEEMKEKGVMSGNKVLLKPEEITEADIWLKRIGFTPEAVAKAYDNANKRTDLDVIKDMAKKVEDLKDEAVALKKGDPKAYNEARRAYGKALNELNAYKARSKDWQQKLRDDYLKRIENSIR